MQRVATWASGSTSCSERIRFFSYEIFFGNFWEMDLGDAVIITEMKLPDQARLLRLFFTGKRTFTNHRYQYRNQPISAYTAWNQLVSATLQFG